MAWHESRLVNKVGLSLILLLLYTLPSCIVRNTKGEVDQEATQQLNKTISDTFKNLLDAGAAAARARMEYQARKKEAKACPGCQGNRSVPCQHCNACGYFYCPACKGKGRIGRFLCAPCSGTGKQTCNICRGQCAIPCPQCTK